MIATSSVIENEIRPSHSSNLSSAAAPRPGSPARALRDPLTELARRAAGGDSRAARELMQQSRGPVSRVVRRVLGPASADLDDVTQDALLALHLALPAFRGDCKVTTYACRIAARVAKEAVRRRAAEQSRRERGELEAILETLPDSSDSPHAQVRGERRRVRLQELLTELPAEQALTLVLRSVQGWTRQELAAATRVSENTVKSRLRLAKASLRRLIEVDTRLQEELDPAC